MADLDLTQPDAFRERCEKMRTRYSSEFFYKVLSRMYRESVDLSPQNIQYLQCVLKDEKEQ